MMDRGRTRYQITEETEQSDGSVFVRVRKQYNDKADVSEYVNIILYGSTARGTRAEDSDVDVAILLHAGATKTMRDQMLDLVVDLELECGRVLSVLCIDYEKICRVERYYSVL